MLGSWGGELEMGGRGGWMVRDLCVEEGFWGGKEVGGCWLVRARARVRTGKRTGKRMGKRTGKRTGKKAKGVVKFVVVYLAVVRRVWKGGLEGKTEEEKGTIEKKAYGSAVGYYRAYGF